ncbi:MAG TPA: cytochrome c3 family protein [Trueperaceae bacterium]
MPQHFPPNANTFARWAAIGGTVFVILLVTVLTAYARVAKNQVGVPVPQPINFPHNLHVTELGLDCRYCHSTVEVSATANIPPTETCMTCHSQVRVGTAQIRGLWDPENPTQPNPEPIEWNRVHDLADFVYFNHSAHINKGIGCSSCHGRVDLMPGIWKAEPMSMGWCLECHKAPEKYVRPREEVFNMAYEPPDNQLELGRSLVQAYHINEDKLPQCSTCHR